jgi:hypothetical protein
MATAAARRRKPGSKRLAELKTRQMAHHFHDENGNYGITSFLRDRAFGTFYDRPQRPKKSPTVFNLGYTDEVAKLYPHVSKLSGGVAKGHPRERIKKLRQAAFILSAVGLGEGPRPPIARLSRGVAKAIRGSGLGLTAIV